MISDHFFQQLYTKYIREAGQWFLLRCIKPFVWSSITIGNDDDFDILGRISLGSLLLLTSNLDDNNNSFF